MAATGSIAVLDPSEGQPAAVINADGQSPLVFICEHASHIIPRALGTLGLAPEALTSHIAWDPGALGVAEALSGLFDAPLVAQRFSRLVYDCNRPPEAAGAIPEKSEIYAVPGNARLGPAEKVARAGALYHPFHAAIANLLAGKHGAGEAPIIVTVHSFTPIYFGAAREGHLGILHDVDSRLADAMILAHGGEDREVRRNWPYGPEDGVTHTLQRHGIANGFLNVMLEIRNDLIATKADQAAWAERLAGLLGAALRLVSGNREGLSVA